MTKKYSDQLSQFISKKENIEQELSFRDRRIFRSLKLMGERATKGREVENHIFEVVNKSGRTTLRMMIEGRSAMAVAHHVAKRFADMDELEFAEVVRTKKGAKVVLRTKGEKNENES